jgi:hypothetical protein
MLPSYETVFDPYMRTAKKVWQADMNSLDLLCHPQRSRFIILYPHSRIVGGQCWPDAGGCMRLIRQ